MGSCTRREGMLLFLSRVRRVMVGGFLEQQRWHQDDSLSLNIQSFSRSFTFCSLIHERFLLDITEDLVEKEKAFTGVFSPFESWRNHEWRDVRMSREIMPCSTQEALWEMRFNLLSLECNPDVNTQQQLWEHFLNPSEWKIMQKIQNNGRNSSKTGTQGSKT